MLSVFRAQLRLSPCFALVTVACLAFAPRTAAQSNPTGASSPEQSSAATVFTGVTIINPGEDQDRSKQREMIVVIAGDKIIDVFGVGTRAIPPGSVVVAATGKFLIPAFWDMHTHTQHVGFADHYFPLYVAHGVLGVRDMGNSLDEVKQWRQAIAEGKTVGPRIFAAGPFVDGATALFSNVSAAAVDAGSARTIVRERKASGADFIKVQSMVPRAAYFALADEAHAQSIPFVGHVPLAVTAEEASVAGQRSIEHFGNFLLGSSTDEEALRTRMLDQLKRENFAPSAIARVVFYTPPPELLSTFDPGRAKHLARVFREHSTWQDPTFTMLKVIASASDPRLTNDPRLKYLPAQVAAWWRVSFLLPRDLTPEQVADTHRFYAKHQEVFRLMREAGVEFLAGTDVGFPFVFPGFSLHEELEHLVEAGATPLEALRIATYNPAKYLGLLDSSGSIAVGKRADLVLLDADPTESIANTRRIAAVVAGGRLLDRARLAALLDQAEQKPPGS